MKTPERIAEELADPGRFTRLRNGERADLRDWFDTSGRWIERMTDLYALVRSIAHRRAALAWEQGWVARGNDWESTDNPYRHDPPGVNEVGR